MVEEEEGEKEVVEDGEDRRRRGGVSSPQCGRRSIITSPSAAPAMIEAAICDGRRCGVCSRDGRRPGGGWTTTFGRWLAPKLEPLGSAKALGLAAAAVANEMGERKVLVLAHARAFAAEGGGTGAPSSAYMGIPRERSISSILERVMMPAKRPTAVMMGAGGWWGWKGLGMERLGMERLGMEGVGGWKGLGDGRRDVSIEAGERER